MNTDWPPMNAPTSLVYPTVLFEGWGTLVYLAGNISEADCWNFGITAWDVPMGIGPVVFIETFQEVEMRRHHDS